MNKKIIDIDNLDNLDEVHVLSQTNYEADDVMFSAAKYCSENGIRCYILSTDKDLCQSLDDSITIAHKLRKENCKV